MKDPIFKKSILDPAGLFSSDDAPPPPAPTVAAEPVPVMPTPDDSAVKQAQRRSKLAQRRRSGRSSTILSDPTESDTLG
jgi:hypothetical protein